MKHALAGDQTELSAANINALISMELLQTLQSKDRKRSRTSSVAGSNCSEESSLESSSSHGKKGGASRALRAHRQGHREMRRNPLKHVKRYVQQLESHIRATKETACALSDFTRRLNWGKQRTLQRVHFALSEILQALYIEKPTRPGSAGTNAIASGGAPVCSLDQGSWNKACLLPRYPDPIETPRFGGEPQELERVAAGYTCESIPRSGKKDKRSWKARCRDRRQKDKRAGKRTEASQEG